jgi:hypothetical protein
MIYVERQRFIKRSTVINYEPKPKDKQNNAKREVENIFREARYLTRRRHYR